MIDVNSNPKMNSTLYLLADYLQLTWCNPTTLVFTWITFFSVTLFVLYQQASSRNRKNHYDVIHFKNLPSPTAYPVLGHVTKLGSQPHLVMTEWAEKYGPLIRLKLGFQDALVVTGLDLIKQASACKSGLSFAGRPEFETSKLICNGLSLAFSNYSVEWEKQRAATRTALQLYTTGKDSSKRFDMENNAAKHANKLAEQLINVAQKQNGVVEPKEYIHCHMTNAICNICFGKDFEIDDPKLKQFLLINQSFDEAMGAAQPVNFWPILQYIPFAFQSFKNLKIYQDRLWDFVSSLLNSHWSTYDPENMRDIADCLYRESEKRLRNNNYKLAVSNADEKGMEIETDVGKNGNLLNGFSNENKYSGNHHLQSDDNFENRNDSMHSEDKRNQQMKEFEIKQRIISAAGDIFGAGYDTTASVVEWSLLYMAAFPDTQEKIRDEINRSVAPEENISYRSHGQQCPYTRAWVYEVLRHTSLTPLLLPRCTTEQTVLNNCFIPAGMTVYFNAWQTHHDPKIWEDPSVFKPERFLKEDDGKISINSSAVAKLLTWGIGKRRCVGQDLSKHQIFIFVSTIVRECVISQSKSGIEPVVPWSYNFGITLKPKPYKIHISRCEKV